MKSLILTLTLLSCLHAYAGAAKVSIHLLDPTNKKITKTLFWIDWNNDWRAIVSTKVVTDAAAEKIIHMLRESLKDTEATHFCGHDPIYGIDAIDADGKVLKTSLCFSCSTWVKPGRRLNIAGELGVNNVLYKKLREVCELPEELLKFEKSAAHDKGQQDITEQPATAPDSKPEKIDIPKPKL